MIPGCAGLFSTLFCEREGGLQPANDGAISILDKIAENMKLTDCYYQKRDEEVQYLLFSWRTLVPT